jgi:uncharacterized GH25 family protein
MAFCPPAFSHNLWLNPGDFHPEVGTVVDIGVGWGHTFPAGRVDQELKEDRVEEIKAVDPDGIAVDLTKERVDLYKLKVEKAGAYVVTAKIKPGFFAMTPEGRKWGDKKAVSNSVKCTNFHIEAKTAIVAGGADKNLGTPAGQALELIPLSNPGRLKAGDKLPVKVLFNGEPLADAKIKATYAGYGDDVAPHSHSEKGEKGAKEGKGAKEEKHYPVETVTDANGQAELKLDKAGYWMVMLSHRSPYPDLETCDEYMYNVAFTCEVAE